MANIFVLENTEDFSEKINLDELYEKKKQHDLNQLALYNKILNRIHVRIKTTSRQKINEQFCWYVVPEIIIGVPKYDQAGCIAYILDKLKSNGFNVRYIHPNTLFISWYHWIPSYVRSEYKKKTGIVIDEFGNPLEEQQSSSQKQEFDYLTYNPNTYSSTSSQNLSDNSNTYNNSNNISKKYTPINSYKPSGNLIYNKSLFDKLENSFN